MSIIGKSSNGTVTSFVKGSPEMIKSLSTTDSIPHWLDSDLMMHTQKGFRVIAYATKTFKSSDGITREQAESQLTFLGLVWMENHVKEVSPAVIEKLKANNLQVMMATGDNILTAISVAQECKIINYGIPVFYAALNPQTREIKWKQVDPTLDELASCEINPESHRSSEIGNQNLLLNQVSSDLTDHFEAYAQFPFRDLQPGEFTVAITGTVLEEVLTELDYNSQKKLIDAC